MIKLKKLLKEDDVTSISKANIPHYRLYNCLVKNQGWKHVAGSLEIPNEYDDYLVRYEKQLPEYSRSHIDKTGFFQTDTEKHNDRLILRLDATREDVGKKGVEWIIQCKLSGMLTHEKIDQPDSLSSYNSNSLRSYENEPNAKNRFGKPDYGVDNKTYFEQEFVFDGLGIHLDCAQLKQKIDQFLMKYQKFKK